MLARCEDSHARGAVEPKRPLRGATRKEGFRAAVSTFAVMLRGPQYRYGRWSPPLRSICCTDKGKARSVPAYRSIGALPFTKQPDRSRQHIAHLRVADEIQRRFGREPLGR